MKILIPILFLASILPCQQAYANAFHAIWAKDGAAHSMEFVDAIVVNIRPELDYKLAPIVAAIRYAENGRAGREYGILHPKCPPTYRGQAGWCAATVQKNYDRWVLAGKPGLFLAYLARRYAPIDVDNDPNGLNEHWLRNVTFFYNKFLGSTPND